MKKICLLFSHNLTSEQTFDIENKLKVNEVYKLSQKLQSQWSQVPTDEALKFGDYLEEIALFLKTTLQVGDFVLIQGDFGASYYMVNFCKEQGFVPIYSVNSRLSREVVENGIVKKYSEFKHEFFREYE